MLIQKFRSKNSFLYNLETNPKKLEYYFSKSFSHTDIIHEFEKAREAEFDVKSYDTDHTKSDYNTNIFDVIKEFDLILSCTGKVTIPFLEQSKLKDDVILVSASSSDREFESSKLRTQIPENNNPHTDLKIGNKWLANSDFPINFDGGINDVVPEKIQLTQALMLIGCYQAISSSGSGILTLCENNQEILRNKFKEIVSRLNL